MNKFNEDVIAVKGKKVREKLETIATEKVLNARGDIIAIKYHYADGIHSERKVFIPAASEKNKSKIL